MRKRVEKVISHGGTSSIVGRDAFNLKEEIYEYQQRRSQAENEQSCVDCFHTHFEEIYRQIEDIEEKASHYHALPSPEVSEPHPHERTKGKDDEVGRSLESYGAIGVAKQLRHFCYEISPSSISVEEVGDCEVCVAGCDSITLVYFILRGDTVNGDILGILEIRKTEDDPSYQTDDNSTNCQRNNLVSSHASHFSDGLVCIEGSKSRGVF